ncbi:MAG: D-alanyl-D-alanine carboxypeptidase [Oscillospiraceae bacterium]|nr:D-alanyl-D-alanine carboxypeptidase [Oscillospiraceae bacterium]
MAALALCLSLGAVGPTARALTLPPVEITARAALLVDVNSGETLYERGVHVKAYPASLTKIMTALLALEFAEADPGGLDQEVTASETALADLPFDGSTANIVAGETMTLRDLLYCMMLPSANEASNIIAERAAGSLSAFVARMNERAQALGCENTHFANPHGLHDEDHYTTAYDMYLITREALKHPVFVEISNTATYPIPATNKSPARALYTTNHLISAHNTPQYIYYQAQGVKTGNTSMAGHCLISTAKNTKKKDLYLLSVVLGAEREADTDRVLSFVETKRLFEWGFENFTTKTLLRTTEQICEEDVVLGQDTDKVMLVPARSLEALVPELLDLADVRREIKLFDEGGVTAPVTRGQTLGEITLSYEGRAFGVIPLVASYGVLRDETQNIQNSVKTFFDQDWVRFSLAGLAVAVVVYVAFVIVYNYRRRRERGRGSYRGRRRGWRRKRR